MSLSKSVAHFRTTISRLNKIKVSDLHEMFEFVQLIIYSIKIPTKCSFQMRNQSNASSISDRASFPGYKGEFSTSLEFIYPENMTQIQCYRVMNRKGLVLDPRQDPQVIVNPII